MQECSNNANDFLNIDFLRVMDLIATNNGNVNAQDCLGNSPLIYAVFDGCLNVIKTLVALGADVNRGNNYGYTPLDYAIFNQDQGIAAFLIKCGAAFDKQNPK